LNFKPDVTGHLPSYLGQSETPFSRISFKDLPVTLRNWTVSMMGKIYPMNLICIYPFSKTQLALKLPAFEIPKSAWFSLLIMSAIKLPKLVSSVLSLENLASSSTVEWPAGYSSISASCCVYLLTCSRISESGANISVI